MDNTIPATPAPDHSKEPTRFSIKHGDLPELANAKLGDKVHLHLHGVVNAVRSPDKYSDGETEIHVKSVHGGEPDGDMISEGEGEPPTEDEAKTMPLHELRKKLPHKESY